MSDQHNQTMPLEPNGGNLYRPHRMMVTSGQFWRCSHGLTGMVDGGKWIGCPECAKEDPISFVRFNAA